jgi:hypothetical protein
MISLAEKLGRGMMRPVAAKPRPHLQHQSTTARRTGMGRGLDRRRAAAAGGGGDGEEARLGSTRGDWGRRRLADWNTRSEGIGRGVVQALVREENSNLPLRVEIFSMG